MKTYYPMAQSGELVLPQTQSESRRSYLQSLEGKMLVEELKVWRPHKSHRQVKAIFGLALKILKAEFDDRGWDTSFLLKCSTPTGMGVTIDLLKLYLYAVCPIFNDHGDAVTLSDDSVTTEKASKFLSDIQAWSASQWQIYIPDPDPNWRQK